MNYSTGTIIIDNYEKSNTKKTIEHTQRCKPLISYLLVLESDLRKYEVKPYLITLIHNPLNILKSDAWASVSEDREKVLDRLIELKSVVYGISSIEIHPGKDGTVQASFREDLEEDLDENIKASPKSRFNYKNKKKVKGKVKKTLNKKTMDMIKMGKDILKVIGKTSEKQIIHRKIIEGLKVKSTKTSEREWKNKGLDEKLRRVIGYYDSIGSPQSIYQYLIEIYRKGPTTKYEDFLNNYNFLINDSLTLAGYPHIHIAIGVGSSEGDHIEPSQIKKILDEQALFEDIRVDEKKNNKKYLGSISYVLKNDKYKFVKKLIGEPIVKGFVGMKELEVPMSKLSYKVLRNGNHSEIIEMELKSIDSEFKAMSSKTSYESLVSYIIGKMREGEYRVCRTNLYKRIEGSRMSYEEYMSTEEFYDNITCKSKYSKIALQYKKGILGYMKTPYRKIEGITEVEGIDLIYPQIEFDTMSIWIECNDFFYNTLTGSIVRSNTKYPCYCYCDWLKLDELVARMGIEDRMGGWTQIMKNSEHGIPETCSILYKILVLPKIPKGRSLYSTGPSNSGKTSLCKPFLNIYPPHQIGTLHNEIGRFDLHGKSDMAILQMEDTNPYRKNMEIMLKLLACEPLHVEEKHGGSTRELIRARQFYTGNENVEDEGYDTTVSQKQVQEALDKRLHNMKFNVLCDVMEETTTTINSNSALIVIMCGFYYFNKENESLNAHSIRRVLKVYPHTEDIEPMIQERLEYYNDYYKGRSKKMGAQLKYDAWVQENKYEL